MPNLTNSDSLSRESRAFFERTKMKLAVSFLLSIFAWVLIGWTAEAGGSAAADKALYDQAATNELRQPYYSSGGGAGFAAFCFCLGFLFLCIAGIYISPLCTGSINERKTLCAPTEIRALLDSETDGLERYNV